MPPQPTIDSFAEVCEELAGGDLNARSSRLLKELVLAVEENGGVGKLVLTIAIARSKDGIVQMKPTIKITKPEPGFDSTTMYVAEGGALSRANPRQAVLPKVPLAPGKLVTLPGRPDITPPSDKDPGHDR